MGVKRTMAGLLGGVSLAACALMPTDTVAPVAPLPERVSIPFEEIDDSVSWEYTPAPENLEAREWFQDAKFGVFLHWGLYSQLAGSRNKGGAEWIMHYGEIPAHKYERLAEFFYPHAFDADEWVKAFKDAGAQYVTFTTKHHDGFALYDSEVSDYNVVDATPFERDIVRELKEACDRHGLKFFVYYSQLDWHHEDYYPRGRTGRSAGRPDEGNWTDYLDYQDAQLAELFSNYGEIGGVWFDGWWDHKDTELRNKWRLQQTYEMIHALQPQALIINNHHMKPFPGEDVQPFERDLPGQRTFSLNTTYVSENLPLETAETMNGSWGFSLKDSRFKSTKRLVRTLVGAAGRNANFLLNTGPMPDGRIQPENMQTYVEIGEWLKVHGEGVYGTRGGPVAPQDWGVTTQTHESIYVHVMDWAEAGVPVPLDVDVVGATLLATGEAIGMTKSDDGTLLLDVPQDIRDRYVTVIKLERAEAIPTE